MTTPTHWTISRWKDYSSCPKKYFFRYVENRPSPSHPAAQRGTEIHESIEAYLKGLTDELHSEISPAWQLQIEELRRLGFTAEEQWSFEADWYPKEDGVLWLRMKIDAYLKIGEHEMTLIDFKTGRIYASNVEQIEVYALGGFAMDENIEVINGALWYLDHDEPQEKVYRREQAPKLAKKWEQRADEMLGSDKFKAKPGRQCSWCPFKDICPDAA